MKKYYVYYIEGPSLGIGKEWYQKISGETPAEAYKEFLKKVGIYPKKVQVERGLGLFSNEVFDDHVVVAKNRTEEAKAQAGEDPQEIEGKENVNHNQPKIGANLKDLEIEYQESDWALFLYVCGFLNLILFVIGGIWLFNAGSSDQFMAMNLMIIGLVAGINSFFFAFLVNTFTRIQHNTHLTTLELIKLNKKNDSDN